MKALRLLFQGTTLSQGVQAVHRSPQAMQAVRHNYYKDRNAYLAERNAEIFREKVREYLENYVLFGAASTVGFTAFGLFATLLAAPIVMIKSMETDQTTAAEGMEKAMGIVLEGAETGFKIGSLPFWPLAYPFLKLSDRFKSENAATPTTGAENTAAVEPETTPSNGPR